MVAASDVESAIDAFAAADAADAGVIRAASPSEQRGSFATKARLARLDAGERACRGEAHPFYRPRLVAVPCAEPQGETPQDKAQQGEPQQADAQQDQAQQDQAQQDQAQQDNAARVGPRAPARRQAWPRIVGRAPVALPVPQSWQDRALQDRTLQDSALQDSALQDFALHDPSVPQQARPDEAPAPPAAVTERERPSSPVDEYLCRVYWRMPHKIDDAGDFSWKDGVAAAMAERTICDYAINGMHPDLREALYVLGRKADAAGIRWSLLSGFRDDFRQRIASGFKAKDCESWHGGSCRTAGWGDGRAADVWMADGDGYPVKDASPLLALVDQMAPALGLIRPMRSADPPHVQLNGEWQEIARSLREQRLGSAAPERSASSR